MRHTRLGSVGDLSRMPISYEASEVLQRQSLEIFTIMANAGASFAECLSAVLMSGIDWGANASRDRDGAEGGAANAAPVPQDRQARAEGIAR